MPLIRVSLLEGRTLDQKRELAKAIAESFERIAGSDRYSVNVLFEDVAREEWITGKMLFSGDESAWENPHKKTSAS